MRRRELPAVALAAGAAGFLVLLMDLGSRGFRDYDSALIGYAVGTIFAVALLTGQAFIINRLAGIDYPLWAPREQTNT